MFGMMTRGQVAKRIGKSIATVRRLEGSQLHPKKDANGYMRFDPNEVERVARALRQRKRRPLPSSFFPDASLEIDDDHEVEDPEDIQHRARMKQAEAEAEARAAARRAERVRFEQEEERREAERLQDLQAHATQQLTDLSRLIDSCSPRELRMLSRDPELARLLDSLDDDL
jgi:hypothetical protein